MSWLSVKLPPATKIWKSFTSKLQSKLHKLQRSKVMIKKPQNRLKKTTALPRCGVWPSLLSEKRFERKKRLVHAHHVDHLRHHRQVRVFEKRSTAQLVYVDKLFIEPGAELVQYVKPLQTSCQPSAKNMKHLDQPAVVLQQQQGGRLTEKAISGDDMWESLVLASPLLRGVDERAEEFIARFRAEMEVQEMFARVS
ncbi:hypothetical protein I3843_03G246900 [Carya illinoinensis]|uniref:Uncharacterized protein n=1 Tax=Carya illinoinensis TaxID=32201 RepID=A0A8T1R7D9_CARIL|nr:uncharacterized protein LOC122305787 [Carya illinoinensis]KAG2719142.1 hypothetical protein I3760_03G255600 [Carya illinoinensis]KAG6662727.1 hypothetical protein CIPAW_03G264200 [Carya illinoinensis]KAG6724293.1 hypothetical protein I3842_03G253600 [Carya illinoinensis]KAG7989570.1 hypothetical protein I3843_03G246900 [Carya illinoinensis]